MKILGIGCASYHDPSAALVIDGEVVAAAEEERFTRVKHAYAQRPVNAARFCLERAGVRPEEIDLVAYPWSAAIIEEKKWEYARRVFHKSPSKALGAFTRGPKRKRRREKQCYDLMSELGIDPKRVEVQFVEHHISHASSAFHLSGFESAAILTIDGEGEVTTTLFGEGLADGRIVKHKEILKPDSLGLFYGTMTEYLGFRSTNGEYKVMGMAPYGDPDKIDLRDIVELTDDGYRCDDDRVWVVRKKRHTKGKRFGASFIDEWGPMRQGDDLNQPYVDIAAATQKRLEEIVLALIPRHLGDVLARHGGRLCYAGGVALNVRLNRKIIALPEVNQLWVQPASSDAGIALGAATYAAVERGQKIKPMTTVALGPSFTGEEVRAAAERYRLPYHELTNPPDTAAALLAAGEVIAWFEGRMEWGPRSLGQRSILGNPGKKGTSDDINRRIKFREPWRPFCPSVLEDHADAMFEMDHPSPFMTFTFKVKPEWAARIPEVVHVDGSARPQFVTPEVPKFHALLTAFHRRTGLPVVINTSLNRRGEPMVCSPDEALAMFYGSGLEFLVMEDILITKRRELPEGIPTKT